jgi:hypothetical protein
VSSSKNAPLPAKPLANCGVPARVVGAAVGDPDPLVSIEDALRAFPADEVILVTRPEEAATWFEQDALDRIGLPVTHLADDEVALRRSDSLRAPSPPPKANELGREVVRGESPWSGFLAQGAVFLVVAGGRCSADRDRARPVPEPALTEA